jgi:hypothetical protein
MPIISPRPFSPGNPRWHQQRAYEPTLLRAGPVFALVAPSSYVVHLPTPSGEPHLHGHDIVTRETEVILVLIVCLLVAGKVIVRFIGDLGQLTKGLAARASD